MRDVLKLIGLVVGVPLLIYALATLPQVVSLFHQETVTAKVVKSERIADGDRGKYLVYGAKEVYQNAEAIVMWKFNSSDFYRDIQPDKTYRFHLIGWRIPFLSTYRNIVRYEIVE